MELHDPGLMLARRDEMKPGNLAVGAVLILVGRFQYSNLWFYGQSLINSNTNSQVEVFPLGQNPVFVCYGYLIERISCE
jgi:hypothetical protein